MSRKMDVTETVLKARQASWVRRWETLSIMRASNDYSIAELAHEIREEFPAGDAGDLQFKVWIKRALKGSRGPNMLAKAQALDVYGETEWKRLGGWQGISFLCALPSGQRHRLVTTLKGEGPFHYSTIRKRALKLGIVSKRRTRDTRSASEERVNTLRMFLVSLYKKRSDLPAIPAAVKSAMTPTILSLIPHEARA